MSISLKHLFPQLMSHVQVDSFFEKIHCLNNTTILEKHGKLYYFSGEGQSLQTRQQSSKGKGAVRRESAQLVALKIKNIDRFSSSSQGITFLDKSGRLFLFVDEHRIIELRPLVRPKEVFAVNELVICSTDKPEVYQAFEFMEGFGRDMNPKKIKSYLISMRNRHNFSSSLNDLENTEHANKEDNRLKAFSQDFTITSKGELNLGLSDSQISVYQFDDLINNKLTQEALKNDINIKVTADGLRDLDKLLSILSLSEEGDKGKVLENFGPIIAKHILEPGSSSSIIYVNEIQSGDSSKSLRSRSMPQKPFKKRSNADIVLEDRAQLLNPSPDKARLISESRIHELKDYISRLNHNGTEKSSNVSVSDAIMSKTGSSFTVRLKTHFQERQMATNGLEGEKPKGHLFRVHNSTTNLWDYSNQASHQDFNLNKTEANSCDERHKIRSCEPKVVIDGKRNTRGNDEQMPAARGVTSLNDLELIGVHRKISEFYTGIKTFDLEEQNGFNCLQGDSEKMRRSKSSEAKVKESSDQSSKNSSKKIRQFDSQYDENMTHSVHRDENSKNWQKSEADKTSQDISLSHVVDPTSSQYLVENPITITLPERVSSNSSQPLNLDHSSVKDLLGIDELHDLIDKHSPENEVKSKKSAIGKIAKSQQNSKFDANWRNSEYFSNDEQLEELTPIHKNDAFVSKNSLLEEQDHNQDSVKVESIRKASLHDQTQVQAALSKNENDPACLKNRNSALTFKQLDTKIQVIPYKKLETIQNPVNIYKDSPIPDKHVLSLNRSLDFCDFTDSNPSLDRQRRQMLDQRILKISKSLSPKRQQESTSSPKLQDIIESNYNILKQASGYGSDELEHCHTPFFGSDPKNMVIKDSPEKFNDNNFENNGQSLYQQTNPPKSFTSSRPALNHVLSEPFDLMLKDKILSKIELVSSNPNFDIIENKFQTSDGSFNLASPSLRKSSEIQMHKLYRNHSRKVSSQLDEQGRRTDRDNLSANKSQLTISYVQKNESYLLQQEEDQLESARVDILKSLDQIRRQKENARLSVVKEKTRYIFRILSLTNQELKRLALHRFKIARRRMAIYEVVLTRFRRMASRCQLKSAFSQIKGFLIRHCSNRQSSSTSFSYSHKKNQ